MSDYNQALMFRDDKGNIKNEYLTDLIADDAITFIRKCVASRRPFLASVNFTAPHSPWVDQHPARFLAMYDDCAFESCPQEPVHPWGPPLAGVNLQAQQDPRPSLVGYFAAVTAMDEAIGRLLAELTTLGVDGNTVVIFIGDNGFNAGHHGMWGKGNATFPMNLYDTSVKVPLIIRDPALSTDSLTIDDLVSAYDIMPTLMERFSLPGPDAGHLLPGTSLLPLLRRQSSYVRDHVVIFDEYGPARMIRTPDWKLIKRYPYGPDELYDLRNDPGETSNRSSDLSLTGTLSELRHELEAWFDRYTRAGFDGRLEAVSGIGQRNIVHAAGNWAEAFYPLPWEAFPRADYRHNPW